MLSSHASLTALPASIPRQYKIGWSGENPGDPHALLSSRDTFIFDGLKRKLRENFILQYATAPCNSSFWSAVKFEALSLVNNASFLALIFSLTVNAWNGMLSWSWSFTERTTPYVPPPPPLTANHRSSNAIGSSHSSHTYIDSSIFLLHNPSTLV